VPARDEASVIERCLAGILACDYPPERFEIIVVDDLSVDETPALVERLAHRVNASARTPVAILADGSDEEPAVARERVHLLRMPENLERARAHKKRAIEKGVAQAEGDIILTTDADCLVPRGWIGTMAACFDDILLDAEDARVTAFVSGPVLYRVERGGLMKMQALEFLGLVSFGAGVIGLGQPVTCNGANVAYRKDVFESLGGFSGIDHLTSGDDELLMQKVARETPHRVRFCSAPAAAVETDGLRTLAGFVQQRRRWASKGIHYPSAGLVGSLAVVYLFHVALVAGALTLPFVPELTPIVVGAFALDLLAATALAGQAAVHFGRPGLLAWLIPTEILRLPYFVLIGIAGAFGGFEWKGRRIRR
jgi:cellulose synthase/poly-beta-1,6-N-acetylglucosamine synthase-like glycosyltransferase